jgi:hypothetical protein
VLVTVAVFGVFAGARGGQHAAGQILRGPCRGIPGDGGFRHTVVQLHAVFTREADRQAGPDIAAGARGSVHGDRLHVHIRPCAAALGCALQRVGQRGGPVGGDVALPDLFGRDGHLRRHMRVGENHRRLLVCRQPDRRGGARGRGSARRGMRGRVAGRAGFREGIADRIARRIHHRRVVPDIFPARRSSVGQACLRGQRAEGQRGKQAAARRQGYGQAVRPDAVLVVGIVPLLGDLQAGRDRRVGDDGSVRRRVVHGICRIGKAADRPGQRSADGLRTHGDAAVFHNQRDFRRAVGIKHSRPHRAPADPTRSL